MESKAFLRYLLSPWVIGGTIIVGVSMLCAALFLLIAGRTDRNALPIATAIVHVIPLPSATSTLPPATATAESAPPPPLPPASGDIVIGAFVQVSGTGGDGLRLRAEPGLEGTVRFLGLEAEVFQVSDGPRQIDSYNWWFLVAPFDSSVQGWAVANFLAVVQSP